MAEFYITANGFKTGAQVSAERLARQNKAHKRRVRQAIRLHLDASVLSIITDSPNNDTWVWAARLEAKRRGLTIPKGGE